MTTDNLLSRGIGYTVTPEAKAKTAQTRAGIASVGGLANYRNIYSKLTNFAKLSDKAKDFIRALAPNLLSDTETIKTGSRLGDIKLSELVDYLATREGENWLRTAPRWQMEQIFSRGGAEYYKEPTQEGYRLVQEFPTLGMFNLGEQTSERMGLRGTATGEQAAREYGTKPGTVTGPASISRWGRLPSSMTRTGETTQGGSNLSGWLTTSGEEEEEKKKKKYTYAPPARWLTY